MRHCPETAAFFVTPLIPTRSRESRRFLFPRHGRCSLTKTIHTFYSTKEVNKDAKRKRSRRRSRRRFLRTGVCWPGLRRLRLWRIPRLRLPVLWGRSRQSVPLLPEFPVATEVVVGDAVCVPVRGNDSVHGRSVSIGLRLRFAVRDALRGKRAAHDAEPGPVWNEPLRRARRRDDARLTLSAAPARHAEAFQEEPESVRAGIEQLEKAEEQKT